MSYRTATKMYNDKSKSLNTTATVNDWTYEVCFHRVQGARGVSGTAYTSDEWRAVTPVDNTLPKSVVFGSGGHHCGKSWHVVSVQ